VKCSEGLPASGFDETSRGGDEMSRRAASSFENEGNNRESSNIESAIVHTRGQEVVSDFIKTDGHRAWNSSFEKRSCLRVRRTVFVVGTPLKLSRVHDTLVLRHSHHLPSPSRSENDDPSIGVYLGIGIGIGIGLVIATIITLMLVISRGRGRSASNSATKVVAESLAEERTTESWSLKVTYGSVDLWSARSSLEMESLACDSFMPD
jgi:hypothetical protein